MLTFLFWNTGRKPLEKSIARLACRHDVDVLMLAEAAFTPDTMLRALNARVTDAYHFPFSECKRVAVYTRFPGEFLWPVQEDEENGHYSIRQLMLPARINLTLVVAHLRSKLHRTEGSPALTATEFARIVREAEARAGHTRTVLVGDLNMNPFEYGLVAAPALNAVMTREIASRGSRVVESQRYPFFYNPMWGHLGDGTDGPPGTYYRSESDHVAYFWHITDQVLIRPDLLGAFRNEDLQILTSDGVRSLLSRNGLPAGRDRSDHLPVLFTLDM